MIRAIDGALEVIAWLYFRVSQVLLVLLVAGIFSEVLTRYFVSKTFVGSGELANLALVWIVFLMAAVLHRRRRHIAVTAAVDMMNHRARRVAAGLVSLGTIVLSFYIMLQFIQVVPFLQLKSPVFRLPDLLFKSAPIFALLPIAVQSLIDLIAPTKRPGSDDAKAPSI
jgi:TRAP-type C4-dicarboxylate transport system permease small subunit